MHIQRISRNGQARCKYGHKIFTHMRTTARAAMHVGRQSWKGTPVCQPATLGLVIDCWYGDAKVLSWLIHSSAVRSHGLHFLMDTAQLRREVVHKDWQTTRLKKCSLLLAPACANTPAEFAEDCWPWSFFDRSFARCSQISQHGTRDMYWSRSRSTYPRPSVPLTTRRI